MANQDGELEKTFSWLIKDLKDNEYHTKTILFCSSLKEFGYIYDTLLQCLPDTHLKYIGMYHGRTPERPKDQVLSDIVKYDSQIELVVATSALGMGINIPDISKVLHYGIPKDIEAYVQATGRGGRDGSSNVCVLYYRNYHLRNCDVKMREFIKNKEHCCRKDIQIFLELSKSQCLCYIIVVTYVRKNALVVRALQSCTKVQKLIYWMPKTT